MDYERTISGLRERPKTHSRPILGRDPTMEGIFRRMFSRAHRLLGNGKYTPRWRAGLMLRRATRLCPLGVGVLMCAVFSSTAFAHVRPQTTNPPSGARLAGSPAHLVLNYDGVVDPSGSSVVVLDANG